MDIETTGHDPLRLVSGEEGLLKTWHEIIEIACIFVAVPGFEIVGGFETLVKPRHPERFDPAIVPINNFEERWRSGEWDAAPSLEKAVETLLARCRRHSTDPVVVPNVVIPGGQNFFFDWSFLSVAFASLGIGNDEYTRSIGYKRFDVASMAIQELWDPRTPFDPSDFSLRSGKLQEALGIEPEPKPHRAVNGARQAFLVFHKLAERKVLRLETASCQTSYSYDKFTEPSSV